MTRDTKLSINSLIQRGPGPLSRMRTRNIC